MIDQPPGGSGLEGAPPSDRTRSRLVLRLAPLLPLVLWRCLAVPSSFLWDDFVLLLCAFWAFLTLAGDTVTGRRGTVAFMAALTAIYARNQVPHWLGTWGLF